MEIIVDIKEFEEIKKELAEIKALLHALLTKNLSVVQSEVEEVMTPKQVMDFLDITHPTLRKLESQRLLKVKRIGTRDKRYLKSWVLSYLEGKRAA